MKGREGRIGSGMVDGQHTASIWSLLGCERGGKNSSAVLFAIEAMVEVDSAHSVGVLAFLRACQTQTALAE